MRRLLAGGVALVLLAAIAVWIASAFGAGEQSRGAHLSLLPNLPARRRATHVLQRDLLLRVQRAIARDRLRTPGAAAATVLRARDVRGRGRMFSVERRRRVRTARRATRRRSMAARRRSRAHRA